MVSAKDLRDVFEDIRSQAGKRASDFMSDAKMPDMSKMPELRRRDEPSAIVWLGLGLVLGAIVGMAIALIAAPYPGQETRRRLGQQVDKIKRQGEEQIEQIRTTKNTNGGPSAYTTPTTAYERS
jgi:preprotein translocase subunit Sss1